MSAGDLRGLRLAVLAPISWPSPPPGYGPWEQVASDIADGMAARGLDVTEHNADGTVELPMATTLIVDADDGLTVV